MTEEEIKQYMFLKPVTDISMDLALHSIHVFLEIAEKKDITWRDLPDDTLISFKAWLYKQDIINKISYDTDW